MATTRRTKADQDTGNFTAEERAAMKARAAEVRASRRKPDADLEPEVLAKIAEMTDRDRAMAERVHAIVRASAPELAPRLWYGMPAYARAGKVVCFFTPADKFKARYATLGFNEDALLDDGDMWATAFALTAMSPDVEARIADLVRRAAG